MTEETKYHKATKENRNQEYLFIYSINGKVA